MHDLKPILERTGWIASKQDYLPSRYALRYVVIEGGKRREKAIQLGADPKVVEHAKRLLTAIQEEYRRRSGGLPCRSDTEQLLMRSVPFRPACPPAPGRATAGGSWGPREPAHAPLQTRWLS